jgi:lipid-A-disaccharide synthase
MPTYGPEILISAGEASGDLYASELVAELRRQMPGVRFFGCAGERMKAAGVEPVVDAASLGVVGIFEVIAHIPRIYGEFRKLLAAARARRPALAILTDSPDFHLRLAKKLRAQGVPVVYLIAPQAWAWRKGRTRAMARDLARLLCIFPFEERFFRERGVAAHYIGNPLPQVVKPRMGVQEFFERNQPLDPSRPLITLLPGSRTGEIARHLPVLAETVRRLAPLTGAQFALALPAGAWLRLGPEKFKEPFSGLSIQLIEGQTWDAMAQSRLLLAASGTVATEAAVIGIPMVTFYKVKPATWHLFRRFVDVPFFTIINLVAGRRVVPELIQDEMTAEGLVAAVLPLMADGPERRTMLAGLAEVRLALAGAATGATPMERAAAIIMEVIEMNTKGIATHAG